MKKVWTCIEEQIRWWCVSVQKTTEQRIVERPNMVWTILKDSCDHISSREPKPCPCIDSCSSWNTTEAQWIYKDGWPYFNLQEIDLGLIPDLEITSPEPLILLRSAVAGKVSDAVRNLGHSVAPVLDLSNSKHYDLSCLRLMEWIVYMLEENHFRSFLIAPPCTSFSPAAHPAVRSYKQPLGFDRLNPKTLSWKRVDLSSPSSLAGWEAMPAALRTWAEQIE